MILGVFVTALACVHSRCNVLDAFRTIGTSIMTCDVVPTVPFFFFCFILAQHCPFVSPFNTELNQRRSTHVNRDFKIAHHGRLGRLDRCHVTENTRDLLPSSFWDVCFRRVSRREDNGETHKSSYILIVTFLLKLSSQWVKYALACAYIDLPIGEMQKKKSENV